MESLCCCFACNALSEDKMVYSDCFGTIGAFLNYFVSLRITAEGVVPEMRVWSILLIKSGLKRCIELIRSLFLYKTDQISSL